MSVSVEREAIRLSLQPLFDKAEADGLWFFHESSQVGQVDRIVLAGGCASIEGADEVITSKTGVEVNTANPFANMSLSSKVRPNVIGNDAPALMIACGLAMRNAY